MAEKKEKLYVSDNARLMDEWHWEKNIDVTPSQLALGSNKKVWWLCSKGHEWQAVINSRKSGYGCPYCSGRFALKGENDLQTVNPTLVKEWNYEKNGDLRPENFTANSGKKVWWKCTKGHEWQAFISNRNRGSGCPYCSGNEVITGYNDLQTVNSTLANEWNYEKNIGLTPEDVMPGSSKKVWWRCNKGHEWKAQVSSRNSGKGCPVCNSERHTSFPEYAILYYLGKQGIETIHSYKGHGYELDIYIPSHKTAIEYDGYYWHKNKKEKDIEKNQKCKKDGIKLLRVREGLPSLNDGSTDYIVQENQKNLSKILEDIISEIIGTSIDIDLKRDSIAIENLREYTEKERSLLFSNPEIALEWNYRRNGYLKPEHFGANSNKKVWWMCSNGHEWQATINNRNKGHKCPFCSGRYSILGETDLQTINHSLANEWNLEKNGNLKPDCFSANSGKKVWWICNKGHEWQATIDNRNKGSGCPFCSGKKVVIGYTDLQTVNPTLANEWNYEKNNGLTPADVTSNSHKKVWWICNKGHEWEAAITSRNSGNRCPYCSGQKILKGYGDLQTVNPTLANEWNYEKNDELMPSDFSPNSHKKIWWKCSKGHEWESTIANRNNGNGCPYCSGRRILIGYNDLQTVNPTLANEWNYEKNGNLKPENFTANSGKKVWWTCSKGHEWQAFIYSRNSGSGCPQCARKKRE